MRWPLSVGVSRTCHDAQEKYLRQYDPETEPRAGDWLGLDERDRIDLAALYHRREGTSLPNAQLHAAIHVVVENQLALGEAVVMETLARLQSEGLNRHDAVHAIGSVLIEHVEKLLRGRVPADEADGHRQYFRELKALTAARWR